MKRTELKRKTPMKRSAKRIKPMRARYSKTFWNGQRQKVSAAQDGRCAMCSTTRGFSVAHIQGLGRKATRNDPDHELNHISNLIGLCCGPMTGECHEAFDAEPLTTRKIVGSELKKKFSWPEE